VKKGYGNVAPIGVRNIFNKGGQVLPYVLKWQKYFDLDFSVNKHPYVIPYQTLIFWTGMWDRATQNTLNFYNLHNVTSGTTFLYSLLTVEVYAVTRQRLLQIGSTNTITYGFETAEHLYVVEADRDIGLRRRRLREAGRKGILHLHTPQQQPVRHVENSRRET
jgi:hypothetical protein